MIKASDVLTDYSVEGEIHCPDCGVYIDFSGSLTELLKYIGEHAQNECVGDGFQLKGPTS